MLNESAAFILDQCDGARSVGELLNALERRYAAPREVLAADLARTLADLRARKLVTG